MEIVHINKFSTNNLLPYDEYDVEMKSTDIGEPHANVIYKGKSYNFPLKEVSTNKISDKVNRWFDSINELTNETYRESCMTIWDIFHS